jgi:hypothetical protein
VTMAKCVECNNETIDSCAIQDCRANVCKDQVAYQNSCTRDHNTRKHAPSSKDAGRGELSMFVRALRGEIVDLKHLVAVENAKRVNAEARIVEREAYWRATYYALVKWLGAAHPAVAKEAESMTNEAMK